MSKFLNLTEFVELAGISRSKAYKLCSQRKVPHMKRFSKLVFNFDEVVKWLNEQTTRVKTNEEIEAEAKELLSGGRK